MIALFGGTFNPVHNGHIALATEVASVFQLECVELVPSFLPVHRDEPETQPQLRRQMVELAIEGHSRLRLNDSELQRQGLSYTVDTLAAIKRQRGGVSICWLMGADSFNSFGEWKQPDRILELANLIVCERPGVRLEPGPFVNHFLARGEALTQHAAGRIVVHEMNPNPCSSTQIRSLLRTGQCVDHCLPRPVLDLIRQQHLYEN